MKSMIRSVLFISCVLMVFSSQAEKAPEQKVAYEARTTKELFSLIASRFAGREDLIGKSIYKSLRQLETNGRSAEFKMERLSGDRYFLTVGRMSLSLEIVGKGSYKVNNRSIMLDGSEDFAHIVEIIKPAIPEKTNNIEKGSAAFYARLFSFLVPRAEAYDEVESLMDKTETTAELMRLVVATIMTDRQAADFGHRVNGCNQSDMNARKTCIQIVKKNIASAVDRFCKKRPGSEGCPTQPAGAVSQESASGRY